MQLDELIGEVRREAARRRAAPDFPLDQEAAIVADLDSLGPVGAGRSGADLARILARLRQLGAPPVQAADEEAAEPDPVAELAALIAAGINALAARLDHLQRRVGRPPDTSAGGTPAGASEVDDRSAGIDPFVGLTGPVLVAGPGASGWVDALAAAGVEASGIDPTLAAFDDHTSVRAGWVGEYLGSVDDSALTGVLIVGPRAPSETARHHQLCADLARVTNHVVVWSESPWAWRLRLGDATADLEPYRPLSAETWLDGLARAGMVGTGRFGPDGRSYLIQARASGSAVA